MRIKDCGYGWSHLERCGADLFWLWNHFCAHCFCKQFASHQSNLNFQIFCGINAHLIGINPKTGEVLPPGEKGELVITCIYKEALPLIRYRTKDVTRLIYEPCKCGRTTVRMENLIIFLSTDYTSFLKSFTLCALPSNRCRVLGDSRRILASRPRTTKNSRRQCIPQPD